jgi:trans-2-enoyl-CoA reductase
VWQESQVQRVPGKVPLEFAATMTVNPCTAYRMLLDFVTLREGDAVIQNGANGGVGKAVIQIASRRKIKTINIVRKKRDDDFQRVEQELYSLGATLVVGDDDLVRVPFMGEVIRQKIGDLPALALNCVGGENATNMSRYLRFALF